MNTYKLTEQQKRLAEDNMSLVKYAIIKRFGKEMLADEDLLQCGYLGLCKAALRFDPSRGVAFSTFAYRCICNEVCYYLSNKPGQKAYRNGYQLCSLNAQINIDDESTGEVSDMIEDSSVDVEGHVLNRVICEKIDRPSKLYKQHYVDGYTLDHMARMNGAKRRQEVFRELKSEMKRLRKELGKMGVTSRW